MPHIMAIVGNNCRIDVEITSAKSCKTRFFIFFRQPLKHGSKLKDKHIDMVILYGHITHPRVFSPISPNI